MHAATIEVEALAADPAVARLRAYVLVLVGVVVFSGYTAAPSLPSLGKLLPAAEAGAPDFVIDTVRHGSFRLADHRGDVVVVDLMAVDCASCRITEKAMLELAVARPDVQIVSVDIWTTQEDEAYLDGHMQRLEADWPYGMDTDDLLFKYDAFEISKVVIVDRDGFISHSVVGGISFEQLAPHVDAALAGEGGREGTLQLGLVGFAAFAGVASFFAPCAFPLLPGYFAYSLSLSQKRRGSPGPENGAPTTTRARDAIGPGSAAALGILLVYLGFGLIVAALGPAVQPILPYMQPAVGGLAVLLGLLLILGFSMDRLIGPLQRGIDRARSKVTGTDKEGTLAGYFSYGVGYGAAAAGCVAPVFLQLTLTALATGVWTGIRIFLVFAGVSAALMVVATIIAVKAQRAVQRQAGAIVRWVNRASGVVLLAAGVWLLYYFNLGRGLPVFG